MGSFHTSCDHISRTTGGNRPKRYARLLKQRGEPKSRPPLVLKEWQQILPDWLSNAGCDAAFGSGRAGEWLRRKSTRRAALPQGSSSVYPPHNIGPPEPLSSCTFKVRQRAQSTLLRTATSTLIAPNPWHGIVFCLVAGELESARTLLGRSDAPEEAIDVFLAGIIRIALILADVSENGGQPTRQHYRQTVRTYRELVTALPSSASLRVGLASSLIGLVTTGVSTNPHRDLDEALQQAILGRDLVAKAAETRSQLPSLRVRLHILTCS